jgi:hypothetical protein
MDALVRTAPPPGSANAGDLYVDFQTRTLWLGVDPAVEPDEFVLISDIMAFEAQVEGAVVEAKAYTDVEILTRAPTVHTHNAAQITDFSAAVQAVIAATPGSSINRGLIAMFSGSLAEIGVGNWAGWALCDGSQGTPNLRDKFIMGAGNVAVGTLNPAASLSTTGGGSHIHSVAPTAITHAQMPYHNHGGGTGYVSSDHSHHVSGVTDVQGHHGHTYLSMNPGNSQGGNTSYTGGPVNRGTAGAGDHQHNWSAQTGGISANHYHGVNAEGGNQGHTHDIIGGGGTHEHNVSSGQIRDTIPYYALAFVMKL